MWRLGDLNDEIRAQAAEAGVIDTEVLEALGGVLIRLHRLSLDSGLCLPAPQIDANPEATVDVLWIDRRNERTLGVTVLLNGSVWLHKLDGQSASDRFDPSDEELLDELRWLVAKRLENNER